MTTLFKVSSENTVLVTYEQLLDRVRALGEYSAPITITPVSVPELPATFPDPDFFTKAVAEVITLGHFITAVKLVRAATGWGLKDAKDFCDALKV